LDAPTLAQIWVGGIVWWNDTRIVSLNANITLPAQRILLASSNDTLASISQTFGYVLSSNDAEFAAQWEGNTTWGGITGISDHLTDTGYPGAAQPNYVKVRTCHACLVAARSRHVS
jgi:hypothetical protein